MKIEIMFLLACMAQSLCGPQKFLPELGHYISAVTNKGLAPTGLSGSLHPTTTCRRSCLRTA